MRKMATALIATVLLATVGVGAALAADLQVPRKDPSTVQAQVLSGIPGDTAAAKAALAEPSAVRYKLLVVTDSLPEDRTAYLDRVLEQWGWPESDQLLLVVFTRGNYDLRFAMGSDFTQKGVTVAEMIGYIHDIYIPELRKGDPGKALAAFVRQVNKRMLPAGGLTPEQVVKGFYYRHMGYLSPTDTSLSGNQLVDMSYRTNQHLAPEFVAVLDEYVKSEVMVDRILCAQNRPEQITVGKTKVHEDIANVIVGTHWSGGAVREISVALKKIEGQWKITLVTCPK